MHAYIWEYTGPVSNRWHDGGGLVIVAPTLDRAKTMWAEHCHRLGIGDSEAADTAPDYMMGTSPIEPERIWVFPDSGCC